MQTEKKAEKEENFIPDATASKQIIKEDDDFSRNGCFKSKGNS